MNANKRKCILRLNDVSIELQFDVPTQSNVINFMEVRIRPFKSPQHSLHCNERLRQMLTQFCLCSSNWIQSKARLFQSKYCYVLSCTFVQHYFERRIRVQIEIIPSKKRKEILFNFFPQKDFSNKIKENMVVF